MMRDSGARDRCWLVTVPAMDSYAKFALQAEGKEMSTTMAVVLSISLFHGHCGYQQIMAVERD
jgi:pyruvate dehydrogenase complex dehydrogenase (E1) component